MVVLLIGELMLVPYVYFRCANSLINISIAIKNARISRVPRITIISTVIRLSISIFLTVHLVLLGIGC